MTLDHAQRVSDGAYALESGGRLRMPPGWREAGAYTLRFTVEGEPQEDSVVRVYSGRSFALIAEQPLAAGENRAAFTLSYDDKYSMIQILGGTADGLTVGNLALDKESEGT